MQHDIGLGEVRTCNCPSPSRWRCGLCGAPAGEFLACSRRCLDAHHRAEHGDAPPLPHHERSLRERQANNRENARNWVDFERHRAQTMGLVKELSPADGICVLGAGNCDDLELSALAAKFGSVHLVDWDGEALERARARLSASDRDRVVLHGGVDLTGLFETVETWGEDEEAFDRLVESAPARIAGEIGRAFDVVLSSSLVSQLCVPLYAILARTPPEWMALMHAVARVHFRTLALLTRPRGHCVLIGDTLYSAARPDPALPLPELTWTSIDRALATEIRNGVPLRNPEFLLTVLTEPDLAKLFERPTLTQPWVWTVENAAMLAYGVVLRATGAALQASARTMLCPRDPSLVDLQTRNNRETSGYWELYAEHRRHVDALLEARDPGDRLVVLGAGNSNGLDLASLTARFREVHLADLDPVALARAVERQVAASRSKIVLHAPIDLGGVLPHLPAWAGLPPRAEELLALPESTAARLAGALPGPFDVVVSEGLLTQLYWTCFKALGNGPVLRSVLPAVLAAHLRALVTLTKPGGSCVLVTDTASSEGLPLEDLLSESEALGLLHELDQRGKLFTGTSPAVVVAALREGELAGRIESLRVVPPWLWQFLAQRSALVYAVAVRTRSDRRSPD